MINRDDDWIQDDSHGSEDRKDDTPAKAAIKLVTPSDPVAREAAGWALALVEHIPWKRASSRDWSGLTCQGAQESGLCIAGQGKSPDGEDLRQFLRVRKRKPWITWRNQRARALSRNIRELAELLGLNEAEAFVLRLAALRDRNEALSAVLERCREAGEHRWVSALHALSGCNKAELRRALSHQHSRLVTFGLVSIGRRSYEVTLELSGDLSDRLHDELLDAEALTRHFARLSPAPTLDAKDFPHLQRDTAILLPWLRHALEKGITGCNVLIHGEPGVGKTEYARWLAKELHVPLLEVPLEDDDGDPITGHKRFMRLGISQHIAARRNPALVLFDEVEDALECNPFRGQTRSKAWANERLEDNAVPTLWLCNHTGGIDPAHLRRFDIVIHMRTPPRSQRLRIAREAFAGSNLPDTTLDAIAAHPRLTPAHVACIADVISALPSLDGEQKVNAVHHLAKGRLEVNGLPWNPSRDALPGHYHPDLINADTDLAALIQQLRTRPQARLCLDGPPGTGKSAFARHLAQQLDRPLMIRRASELMSKWVGETEKNIAEAFREAQEEAAVLVIDEADSFMGERERTTHQWEVGHINEFLQQLENFEGVFIATTNRMSALDRAAMRRFDYKLRFDWLRPEQRLAMFAHLLNDLGLPASTPNIEQELARMDRLTPGDFAVVRRQLRGRTDAPDVAELLASLRKEVACKRNEETRRIGFLH